MMKRILFLALSMLTLFSFASAQSLPLTDGESVKSRFAANPRAVKDIGDPHILKAGDEALFLEKAMTTHSNTLA